MFQRDNCVPKAPAFKYEISKCLDTENNYYVDIYVMRGIELPKEPSAFEREPYSQARPTKWETTWLLVRGVYIEDVTTLDEAKAFAKHHFELNAYPMESNLK